MNQKELLLLINGASREELTALPGVGPATADQLIEARPFHSIEAVQALKGISKSMLDKLMDEAQLSQVPGETPDKSQMSEIQETIKEKGEVIKNSLSKLGKSASEQSQATRQVIGEKLSGLGESINKQGQTARKVVEEIPDKFDQAAKSRGSLWTVLVSSAITGLLAVLLTFAILGGINGSLKYATGSQFRAIQLETDQLNTQMNTIQQNLDGLRTRVDTLEGFGERTVALEKNQESLFDDVNTVNQQISIIQTELSTLNEKVIKQDERTQRFETFLIDLQTLLGNLFMAQGDNQ